MDLFSSRPAAVSEATQRKFAEHTDAGKEKRYGAVGELDYEISGYIWDCAEPFAPPKTNPRRDAIFKLSDALATFKRFYSEEEFGRLRFLDLGCGDGRSLWALHSQHGLPWTQLMGVTAEDMRGVEVLSSEKPFDLREEAGILAEDSYIVWNIDELDKCPAMTGRCFDLIVSWVTWCWLSDPMGSLEMVYDRFLAPGGVLIIGGVQLNTEGPDPCEDQRWLLGLRDCLTQKEGHFVAAFDGQTGGQTWWVQRKSTSPDATALQLARFMTYSDTIDKDSNSALYRPDLELLGSFAAAYEGRGGEYPLPPAAADSARPIPSTRLRVNEDKLDDEARKEHAEDLLMYMPKEQFDITLLLSTWMAAEPLKQPLAGKLSQEGEIAVKVKSIFRVTDANQDGYISQAELEAVFRKLGSWSDAEFKSLFSKADRNEDGRLAYEEFLDWVMSAEVPLESVKLPPPRVVFSVTVSLLSGESQRVVGLYPDSSVCVLCEKVSHIFDIPLPEVSLLFEESTLSGAQMLHELGVREGAHLTCVRANNAKFIEAITSEMEECTLDHPKRHYSGIKALADPPCEAMLVCGIALMHVLIGWNAGSSIGYGEGRLHAGDANWRGFLKFLVNPEKFIDSVKSFTDEIIADRVDHARFEDARCTVDTFGGFVFLQQALFGRVNESMDKLCKWLTQAVRLHHILTRGYVWLEAEDRRQEALGTAARVAAAHAVAAKARPKPKARSKSHPKAKQR